MTYKQRETSREIRLWIGQIIIPAVTMFGTIMLTNPEIRETVNTSINNVMHKIKFKFKK